MSEVITLAEYAKNNTLTAIELSSAKDLLVKVNSLLSDLGVTKVTVTSGYRSQTHNASIGGAANSKHCLAQAVDLADNDRAIGSRLMTNLKLLSVRGCAIEDLRYCETQRGTKWVHIQSVLPKSGNIVFIPYSGPIRLSA